MGPPTPLSLSFRFCVDEHFSPEEDPLGVSGVGVVTGVSVPSGRGDMILSSLERGHPVEYPHQSVIICGIGGTPGNHHYRHRALATPPRPSHFRELG